MSDICKIECESRLNKGKRAAAKLRLSGKIPCIVYLRDKKTTVSISISKVVANKLVSDYMFMNKICELAITDNCILAVPLEVQFHPVTDQPVHFDFMEVQKKDRICVNIPVVIGNRDLSIGVKRGGDVFIMKYNVRLRVTAGNIPKEIVVDVAGSTVGTKYSLSKLNLADDVEIIQDCLVAKISGPKGKLASDPENDGKEVKA